MLSTVIGPPRSGKSLRGEALVLAKSARPTYVATLPSIPQWSARITRHRIQRTDHKWFLRETFGSEREFIQSLGADELSSDCLLIDGLSALLWGYVVNQNTNRNELAAFCTDVNLALRAVARRSLVVVVDCERPFLEMSNQFWFNHEVGRLHSLLNRPDSFG